MVRLSITTLLITNTPVAFKTITPDSNGGIGILSNHFALDRKIIHNISSHVHHQTTNTSAATSEINSRYRASTRNFISYTVLMYCSKNMLRDYACSMQYTTSRIDILLKSFKKTQ